MPNWLQRQFNPDAPYQRWVTGIAYISSHEGWLYLAADVAEIGWKTIKKYNRIAHKEDKIW
ncbi:hypothetical protein ACCW76_04415 [Pantoea sp. C8B4]|uniref:hypothetical protein n=1 Tax=Pantoea sp. C8B4 TaxID=3243083 RepID=UPI003EDB2375